MRPVRYRAVMLVFSLVIVMLPQSAAYVPTMRDTGLPEPALVYEPAPAGTVPGGYVLLDEIGHLQFYYRDDRDVFAVVDSRNGYTWKTGLDIPFNSEIDRAVDAADGDDAKIEAAVPKESGLNATFIAMANSLLTVEYFDETYNIARLSSAAQRGVTSTLYAVAGEPRHFVLDVLFDAIDLGVKVHVFLTEEGLRYAIFDTEISGAGADTLAALILTPFLGASGGMAELYNPVKMEYGAAVRKPMTPGYIMIPDGPGALIRFRENSAAFKRYVGSVYGVNLADAAFHHSAQLETVPYKEPLMPLYGIAHGDLQAAFVFWADGGAEHLELIVSPEGNVTYYNYAYPRFVYNQVIYQVYNRAGQGYNRLYPERNHLDVDVTYRFLAGDGSSDGLPADYTGMALAYRSHLLETGRLTEQSLAGDMPLHLDFVMSDIKKDIFGYTNMITTTADDVDGILQDILGAGITRVNAGLLGAQKGGVTGGKPWKLAYSGAIGTRGDFKDLITGMAAWGVDVYFSQDYSAINNSQMRVNSNMAYHRNNWGIQRRIEYENAGVPITEISFARPEKSAEWIVSQSKEMKRAGAASIGIDGVTSRLLSTYGSRPMPAAESAALMRDTIGGLGMTVSAHMPNMYLWGVTDRFVGTPLLPTQYIIETDTAPVLQMILYGTMELYGPYANFSFYTRGDILRMIDYNVFPSFVLTEQPAYLLADTNSSWCYSTSYDLYRDMIIDIYNETAGIFRQVAGQAWTGRAVLQNGVILNTYGGGTQVLINYTEEPAVYNGRSAEPLSATVWEGGAR